MRAANAESQKRKKNEEKKMSDNDEQHTEASNSNIKLQCGLTYLLLL